MGDEVEQVMEKELDKLIRLAELDGKIDGLQRKLGKIPAIIEEQRARYIEAQELLEKAREDLAAMQKEHRKAEGDLDGHLEKVRKLNDQTSMVKTNKEYQTILGEIQNLKKEQDGYEEKILELMEKSGEEERKIRAVEGEVKKEKAAFDEEEAKLLAEGERLKSELSGLEGDRGGILSGIDGENLQLYTRVKGLRGAGVAEVRDEICLGCRVSVPPQKYADVIKSDEIQTCSHCQRILFFRQGGDPPKEAE
jgi:hypothetical protein